MKARTLFVLIAAALLLCLMTGAALAEPARVVTPKGPLNMRKTPDDKGKLRLTHGIVVGTAPVYGTMFTTNDQSIADKNSELFAKCNRYRLAAIDMGVGTDDDAAHLFSFKSFTAILYYRKPSRAAKKKVRDGIIELIWKL